MARVKDGDLWDLVTSSDQLGGARAVRSMETWRVHVMMRVKIISHLRSAEEPTVGSRGLLLRQLLGHPPGRPVR